jgi:hypothetical protein
LINHRTETKSNNFLRHGDQPAAQPAISDSYVYHMIATKYRAHLRRGQHHRNRQTAPQGADLPATAFRPVEREEEKRGFARSHDLARFLEAGDHEARPAPETDRVHATVHQQRLDTIRKSCRHYYRPVSRPCELPSRYGGLENIAAWG